VHFIRKTSKCRGIQKQTIEVGQKCRRDNFRVDEQTLQSHNSMPLSVALLISWRVLGRVLPSGPSIPSVPVPLVHWSFHHQCQAPSLSSGYGQKPTIVTRRKGSVPVPTRLNIGAKYKRVVE